MLRHASSSSFVVAFTVTITCSCPAAEVALAGRGAPDTKRGSVAGRTAPMPALPRPTSRVVFTCITPSLITFSDRPCGPGAASRTLHTLEPVAASGSAVSLLPKPASHATRSSRAAAQPDGGDDSNASGTVETTCERLQAALALVDDRMRAGYSAKESARLWDRWREARSQLRDARC